jgi:hypothetical protein
MSASFIPGEESRLADEGGSDAIPDAHGVAQADRVIHRYISNRFVNRSSFGNCTQALIKVIERKMYHVHSNFDKNSMLA